MTSVHGALAVLAAVAAVLVLVAAVALRAGTGGARRWLDRAIIVALVLVGADALLGLALLALGHAPTDLLHLLYGAAALLVLPVARFVGPAGTAGRRAVWVAGGSLVLLGVLLRLAQTG